MINGLQTKIRDAEVVRATHVELRIAEALRVKLATFKAGNHHQLSAGEERVLIGLAQGMTIKAIGALHNLSAKTISTYRARAIEKLGLRSTTDLVLYAMFVLREMEKEGRA